MLLLTQDINSAEWDKEEKIINIYTSHLLLELSNKCFNRQYALKLVQRPPVQQVHSVSLFQHPLMSRQLVAQHHPIQQISFLVFVLQLFQHLQAVHLNKLLQLQNFKKLRNKLAVLEPLSNFADGN